MLSVVRAAVVRSQMEAECRQRCAGVRLSHVRFSLAQRQGAVAACRQYYKQVDVTQDGGGNEPRPLEAQGRLAECTAHFHKPGADHTH